MKQRGSGSGSSSGGLVVLGPGMVVLKGYIGLSEQVKIVKRCRELGGGGFYQPGYGDGTKLHLKMMCLGKNWDPQTSEYVEQRPCDGSHPPPIPPEFLRLVQDAFWDSHPLLNLIPPISPDICIVDFYSQNGRLGLHQDKDECEESLCRGLPVVSFSIGETWQTFCMATTRGMSTRQTKLCWNREMS